MLNHPQVSIILISKAEFKHKQKERMLKMKKIIH
jgi:hypothetical protein